MPLLFGVAGIILGVSHPLLDAWQHERQQQQQHEQQQPPAGLPPGGQPRWGAAPPWSVVLLGIALFVCQYAASGALEQPLAGATLGPLPALDVLLAAVALAHWAAFDGSVQGFGMAALTAVAGPAVEAVLINWWALYDYTHPVVLGEPTWIAWVYFCGGPAVGNLGRRVSADLLARQLKQQRQQGARAG